MGADEEYSKRWLGAIRARRAAGHDVPSVGTLHDLAYCRRYGASFDDESPCPGGVGSGPEKSGESGYALGAGTVDRGWP